MSKVYTAKPKVAIATMVTEREREVLLNEARKEEISLSQVVRRIIVEAIKTAEEATK